MLCEAQSVQHMAGEQSAAFILMPISHYWQQKSLHLLEYPCKIRAFWFLCKMLHNAYCIAVWFADHWLLSDSFFSFSFNKSPFLTSEHKSCPATKNSTPILSLDQQHLSAIKGSQLTRRMSTWNHYLADEMLTSFQTADLDRENL